MRHLQIVTLRMIMTTEHVQPVLLVQQEGMERE